MYEMNGMRNSPPKFNRTSSQICPSPEEELLDAVLKNDTEKVRKIVLSNRHLLSHIYTPEYNKQILLIACREDEVQARTVKTLLDVGANPRNYDETDGLEALHLAAHKTDSNTLRVLLERNPGDINTLTKGSAGGSNALHELIRYGKSDSGEFLRCAELLISMGIDVNQGDSNNVSPVLWAAKKGHKDMIKLILERCSSVDLDSHKIRGQSARDLIEQKHLYDEVLPSAYSNNNQSDIQNLYTLLKQKEEDKFVNYKNGDIEDFVNIDDTNSTLLQLACENGLTKAVRHLIHKGADPRKTCQNTQLPIVIAANHGFPEIFGILLDETEVPSIVLHSLLKYIDDGYHETEACYQLLIKRIKKQWENNPDDVVAMLNERDDSGNTPLHYAVRYGSKEHIQELLDLGASLGAKNTFGVMPVMDIDPEALEKYLDQCVHFDARSKKMEREDFAVTFNYRSIIPPFLKKTEHLSNKGDMESAKFHDGYKKELVAETEVIYYMSNSPEFRRLLTHPVVVSFLFMKWKKVQWFFHANLIFYIMFSLSLVAYIFSDYLYPEDEEKSPSLQAFGKISYVLLTIGLFLLILRETFQIVVTPINYFKNFENYIEVFLIVLTGIIIFDKSAESKKQVASIAILLAVFESMLMLGPHPYFSTRVEMLKTVSLNFFKFLIWYVWLIIAFALSFYILYSPSDWSKKENTDVALNKTSGSDNEEHEQNFFESPGKSVFKTVIMLTGEFDSSDLDFQTFPVTSTLIFALFIFMIAIILLNLLNGLAVSDTQMIKNESELIGHIVRAHYIRHIETMLEGNVIPVNVLEQLRKFCCCFPMSKHWNCKIGKLLNTDTYLFPNYLNYELVFYPYKSGLISLPHTEYNRGVCRTCSTCSLSFLDKETLRRTNDIIQARKEEKNTIEKELEIIKEKLNSLLQLIKPNENV